MVVDVNTEAIMTELEDLRVLVESRGKDIEELRSARLMLERELGSLKLQVSTNRL